MSRLWVWPSGSLMTLMNFISLILLASTLCKKDVAKNFFIQIYNFNCARDCSKGYVNFKEAISADELLKFYSKENILYYIYISLRVTNLVLILENIFSIIKNNFK